MLFVLSQSALALTCDPGDTLCDDVDAMQTIANAEFGGNPVSDGVATGFLDNLRGAADALEAAGCTVDGYLAGKWAGRAGTLSGDSSGGGGVTGVLAGGSFAGTMDGGSTAFGDGFGAIHFKSKRIVANIGDNGLAAGRFIRTSGRVGVFMGITATCGATAPPDAIAPWFPGNLDDWDAGGPVTFDFRTDPAINYERVDRMGMPAVNTALIASKEAYNFANPTDDVAGLFVPEILGSLNFLHSALDDDLALAGLVPCTAPGDGSGSCVAQGAPLIVPDTIKIDGSLSPGFPNGRLPADPVIDVTLSVILLDLSVPGQTPATLIGLNPTENDVVFSGTFPFMGPAH